MLFFRFTEFLKKFWNMTDPKISESSIMVKSGIDGSAR